jgi:hypothetical protein
MPVDESPQSPEPYRSFFQKESGFIPVMASMGAGYLATLSYTFPVLGLFQVKPHIFVMPIAI